MKARALAAGLVIAAGALTVLATVFFKDEIYKRLYGIRRVTTWGELFSQRPIRLSDGVIVRVGIEDTRCQEGSGVLLYCLAEGYDHDTAITRGLNTNSLGPLDVSVLEEGSKQTGVRGTYSRRGSRNGAAPTKMLFAQSIRVPRRGRYHVTVLERGRPLRFATVDGTGEPVHPCLTLQESPRPPGPLDNVLGGERAFLGRFVPCGGEVMIPYWPGYYPFPDAGTQAGLTDPTLPLPQLMPDAEAPAVIDLRNDGVSLIAISGHEMFLDPMGFVARWWINGKPHVPTEVRNTAWTSRTPSWS